MGRQVNAAGVALVREFEGFRATAYRCPAGRWTLGFGRTRGVRPGDRVTREVATQWLREDLAHAGAAVERLVKTPLNDNQFAALASFVFNLGEGSLAGSTLLRRLNAGRMEAVPAELARWVKATDPATWKKRTLPGLERRRAAEAALWRTPPDPSEVGSE